MKDIILLGGAPSVGKTTLAKELARRFDIPWISTDQIRSILKATADKNEYENLFRNTKDITDPREAVDFSIKQSQLVWKAVVAFIKSKHPWEGGVVEGMAILPALVHQDFSDIPNIQSVFVLQNNIDPIKRVIMERSELPWINTKTPAQQDSQVSQIVIFNEYVEKEAKKYGCKTIEVGDSVEKTFDDLLDQINT